jgi:death-on-curing protein
VKYLSPEQVLFIHSRIIDATGGAHGLRDIGLLQSAVSRPRATFNGKDLYKDLFHKAAAVMQSLAVDHPFIDGNKRTAITSAAVFLTLNGRVLEATRGELVAFAVAVAVGLPFHDIAAWFRGHTIK